MSLDLVDAGRDVPENFNVVIEIPMNAEPVKYEVDKETGAIFVDRVLTTPMRYPCNYGYVPRTLSGDADPVDVLALHTALSTLAELDPRQAEVVEMRFFAGLTVEEIAEVLEISPATVKREWATAKLWLRRQMQGL